jgi:hypothetical protein
VHGGPAHPFKDGTGWVDDLPMTIHPLSLIRTKAAHPSSTTAQDMLDYSRYSDDELMTERARRHRQLDELSLFAEGESDASALLVRLDEEVERITDELIRRARSRHPSSFQPAS